MKKMRHAFCIIAHSEPELFKRLCLSLDHSDVDIFVHIDKKTDIRCFYVELAKSKIYYMTNRKSVTWGGFS